MGIKPGDEVIVSDFSFPATGLSVLHAGATPVFCDVDINTYNIRHESIEKHITNKTKAIIPVHTFGNPCKMDLILEIARENGLFVIEDAACAFGSKYRDKCVGTFGDIGCFSFHARKGITTGEGGMVVTENDDIAKTIRKISMFGVEPAYNRKTIPSFKVVGYNYKMSDIAASIGIAQLKKLPEIIERRNQLSKIYRELLNEKKVIKPQTTTPYSNRIYQSFVGITPDRDRMITHLKKSGIESGIGTYAQHCNPVFMSPKKNLNSESLYRKTISLPLYHDLKESEIHIIVEEIHKCR
jgi:dTDP-4-amino-4,6-dideoxygalactose transaminase